MSTSSDSTQPVFHNTQLSLERLPSSVKKTLSNKIDNLVEVTHIPDDIPQDLIREYLAQNYTHLHLKVVRLILTLHGRKGLPVTAKIALLNTTSKEYQHALIGALVTTLTNGSVILTISPDFTMRLTDPTLSQRIKIQVQLIGAIQDAAAEQATLHHQVLYRVQDHALDLKLPNSAGDALLMSHEKNHDQP
ncbi:hypothetical protein PIB30_049743 [Stylosanthes scabra]|uniref:Uncharacterized protein n=1 Tax=Stylosanthes scabra TaxID=79078 RepID=A0ABU6VJQ3_9FABA|nr:hypothetical protein [Stylosanthes scabra]